MPKTQIFTGCFSQTHHSFAQSTHPACSQPTYRTRQHALRSPLELLLHCAILQTIEGLFARTTHYMIYSLASSRPRPDRPRQNIFKKSDEFQSIVAHTQEATRFSAIPQCFLQCGRLAGMTPNQVVQSGARISFIVTHEQ